MLNRRVHEYKVAAQLANKQGDKPSALNYVRVIKVSFHFHFFHCSELVLPAKSYVKVLLTLTSSVCIVFCVFTRKYRYKRLVKREKFENCIFLDLILCLISYVFGEPFFLAKRCAILVRQRIRLIYNRMQFIDNNKSI